ncbi:UNVERIFIED_CONTAM: hypothetical protein K2H54_039703, partial [Gekko kuhli]
ALAALFQRTGPSLPSGRRWGPGFRRRCCCCWVPVTSEARKRTAGSFPSVLQPGRAEASLASPEKRCMLLAFPRASFRAKKLPAPFKKSLSPQKISPPERSELKPSSSAQRRAQVHAAIRSARSLFFSRASGNLQGGRV